MLQKSAALHFQENSKLQSPKTDERQGHLDSNRKEHISPVQALRLVQEAKNLTGESLPIIPLADGSQVQIVSLSSGKFFLCQAKQDGSFPIEYNFNNKGFYENARTSVLGSSQLENHREAAQELLREIKAYLANGGKTAR